MDAKSQTLFVLGIGQVDGVNKIAISFISNDRTNIAWSNASDAREIAKELNRLADHLDPPLKQWAEAGADMNMKAFDAAEAAAAIIQHARRRAKKSSTRKAKRK